MAPRGTAGLLALLASASLVHGIELDTSSVDSIKNASATVAFGLMSWYTSNQTSTPSYDVGTFGEPYWWWESGAIFGSLISYWAVSNDSSYNPTVTQALLAQIGTQQNYMPSSQMKTEGNDDQAFWALACMDALEFGLPTAPSPSPTWLRLAENVWNSQAARWNSSTCGGGLRWQILPFNLGYDYKNTITTATFFQLSARLARYTGNQTYTEWAEKSWAWLNDVGLLTPEYNAFDGTDVTTNCSDVNHVQWSYTSGALLYGAAALYNTSNSSSTWRNRIEGLANASISLFSVEESGNRILSETACEEPDRCNIDQVSFKGIYARWLARSTLLAPFLRDQVLPVLRSSARAAARTCQTQPLSNGTVWCDYSWRASASSRPLGPGVSERLSALDVIQTLLIQPSTLIRRQSDSSAGSDSGSGTNGTNGGSQGSQNRTGGSGGGTGAATSLLDGSSITQVATAVLFGLLAQYIL